MAERLTLRGVSKRYGKKDAVQDVSFGVGSGERVALLGHNGAGKTTLIKLMLGLTRPTGGEIAVLGEAPDSRRAVATRRAVGYLPESIAFHGAMSARQTLRFYARLIGESAERCEELLTDVGLAEVAGNRVRTFSKGMRQRLGIAQALLGKPKILLLDEPTTGLDPALRRWLWQLVDEQRDAGTTVVISSHSLHEIESHADRIGILEHGRLQVFGSLDQLRQEARLPTRLRITVPPGAAAELANRLDGIASPVRMDDSSLDLACINGEKMALVSRIAALGDPVRDIDILTPGLEQIYTHYTGGQA